MHSNLPDLTNSLPIISLVPILSHPHTQSLPFQSIQHVLTTFDAQVTVDGGLIVFAIGQLRVSVI